MLFARKNVHLGYMSPPGQTLRALNHSFFQRKRGSRSSDDHKPINFLWETDTFVTIGPKGLTSRAYNYPSPPLTYIPYLIYYYYLRLTQIRILISRLYGPNPNNPCKKGTYTEVRLRRGTSQVLKFLKDSHYSATLRAQNHAFRLEKRAFELHEPSRAYIEGLKSIIFPKET